MRVWRGVLHSAAAILLAAALPACHARPAAMADSADADTLVDLAYGNDPAQRLDVYRPKDARQAPLILMVHGGAKFLVMYQGPWFMAITLASPAF